MNAFYLQFKIIQCPFHKIDEKISAKKVTCVTPFIIKNSKYRIQYHSVAYRASKFAVIQCYLCKPSLKSIENEYG